MWEVKLKVVSVCTYICLLLGAILWHLVNKIPEFVLYLEKILDLDKSKSISITFIANSSRIPSLQLHCVSLEIFSPSCHKKFSTFNKLIMINLNI